MTESLTTHQLHEYMQLSYPIRIIEESDGVTASIPDLPGCHSYGDSAEQALNSLKDVKQLWIEGRLRSGLPVPTPSTDEEFSGKFVVRIPRSLHRSLHEEAREQGVSLNQYVSHVLSERHQARSYEPPLQQWQNVTPTCSHDWVALEKEWSNSITFWVGNTPPASGHKGIPVQMDVGSSHLEPESLIQMLDMIAKPPKMVRSRQPLAASVAKFSLR